MKSGAAGSSTGSRRRRRAAAARRRRCRGSRRRPGRWCSITPARRRPVAVGLGGVLLAPELRRGSPPMASAAHAAKRRPAGSAARGRGCRRWAPRTSRPGQRHRHQPGHQGDHDAARGRSMRPSQYAGSSDEHARAGDAASPAVAGRRRDVEQRQHRDRPARQPVPRAPHGQQRTASAGQRQAAARPASRVVDGCRRAPGS